MFTSSLAWHPKSSMLWPLGVSAHLYYLPSWSLSSSHIHTLVPPNHQALSTFCLYLCFPPDQKASPMPLVQWWHSVGNLLWHLPHVQAGRWASLLFQKPSSAHFHQSTCGTVLSWLHACLFYLTAPVSLLSLSGTQHSAYIHRRAWWTFVQ